MTFGSYYGLREDSLRHLLVRRLAYANLPYVASLFRTETGFPSDSPFLPLDRLSMLSLQAQAQAHPRARSGTLLRMHQPQLNAGT